MEKNKELLLTIGYCGELGFLAYVADNKGGLELLKAFQASLPVAKERN